MTSSPWSSVFLVLEQSSSVNKLSFLSSGGEPVKTLSSLLMVSFYLGCEVFLDGVGTIVVIFDKIFQHGDGI